MAAYLIDEETPFQAGNIIDPGMDNSEKVVLLRRESDGEWSRPYVAKRAGFYRELLQSARRDGREYKLALASRFWSEDELERRFVKTSVSERERQEQIQLKEQAIMKKTEKAAARKAAKQERAIRNAEVASAPRPAVKPEPKAKSTEKPKATKAVSAKTSSLSHVRYCRPEDFRPEDFPGYTRKPGLSKKGSVVLIRNK